MCASLSVIAYWTIVSSIAFRKSHAQSGASTPERHIVALAKIGRSSARGPARYTLAMSKPSSDIKARPPASFFALGHAELPEEISADGITYRFVKLFKH